MLSDSEKVLTALHCISPLAPVSPQSAAVSADLSVIETLHKLLEAPDGLLNVVDAEGTPVGAIDAHSMLEALSRLLASRFDSSLITLLCPAADYSASLLARAVEDADAHLVDLFSAPAEEGKVRVVLRVRHSDPSAAVRSLERYGFVVDDTAGAFLSSPDIALERMAALISYLNV